MRSARAIVTHQTAILSRGEQSGVDQPGLEPARAGHCAKREGRLVEGLIARAWHCSSHSRAFPLQSTGRIGLLLLRCSSDLGRCGPVILLIQACSWDADLIYEPLRDLRDGTSQESGSETRFSLWLTPALAVWTYSSRGDDEAAMPAHVDAAGQHALAVAKRIIGEIAEEPVLARSCRVDPDRTFRKAIVIAEFTEGAHAIGATVPVGIEYHETSLSKRKSRCGIGVQVPELAYGSFVTGCSCLPPRDAGPLVKIEFHSVVADADRKDRQTGRGEFQGRFKVLSVSHGVRPV